VLIALGSCCIASAGVAHAEPTTDPSASDARLSAPAPFAAPPPTSTPRPPLTLAPALVPIGIGAVAGIAGGAVFWLTGASRQVVGPATLVAVSGFSLVAIGLLLDGYGVLAPRDHVREPLRDPPTIETAFGYQHVYDPQFAYRSFLTESVDVRWRRLHLAPTAAFAANDANARLRLLAGFRVFGPTPHPDSMPSDGSFLDVEAAATHHAYRTEGFAVATGELSGSGRLDMSRVAATFDGSFAEMSAGWALASTSYAARGASDVDGLLLLRAAMGVYLGRGAARGSEAMLYYDHRHDDFAGGLLMNGIVSGVFGHFGARTRFYFLPEWGVVADVEAGSAIVAGISLLYRTRGASP
jgi:hypothetical protein